MKTFLFNKCSATNSFIISVERKKRKENAHIVLSERGRTEGKNNRFSHNTHESSTRDILGFTWRMERKNSKENKQKLREDETMQPKNTQEKKSWSVDARESFNYYSRCWIWWTRKFQIQLWGLCSGSMCIWFIYLQCLYVFCARLFFPSLSFDDKLQLPTPIIRTNRSNDYVDDKVIWRNQSNTYQSEPCINSIRCFLLMRCLRLRHEPPFSCWAKISKKKKTKTNMQTLEKVFNCQFRFFECILLLWPPFPTSMAHSVHGRVANWNIWKCSA